MSQVDYAIYDADRHIYEPPAAFLDNLPKEFRKVFQYVQINGRTKLAVDGHISEYIPNPTFEVVAAPGSHEEWYRGNNPEGKSFRELTEVVKTQDAFHDGNAHLKTMDEQGIHAGLLLPTLASVIEERLTSKPESIAALFHALNKWVVENIGMARDNRLFPVPMVNLADVDLAVKELDYLLENGARCVGIRPAPVPGLHGSRSMGYPEFDPFWKKVSDAGIFVVLHVSDSGYDKIYRWWTEGGKGEWLPFEKDPFQEVLDITMGRPVYDTLAALICHGVFDRFPNVRVASLENGSKWLPLLLKMLEHTYHKMPQCFKENPVETFKRHVFVAPFYEESARDLIDTIGVKRVLFGSDWPHPEGLGKPLSYFSDLENLTPDEVKRVMHTNLKGLLEGVRD